MCYKNRSGPGGQRMSNGKNEKEEEGRVLRGQKWGLCFFFFFFFHLKKILGRGGGSLLLRSGVRPAAKVNGEMRQLLQGRD